jgi:copper chaperone
MEGFEMKQVTLQVNGMSCQHCVNAIERALKEVGADGKVNLQANTVTVEYDEQQLSLEKVKEAIEEQGYEVA